VETAVLAFTAGERRAEPFPQDQRVTCSPRPSHPRILFLLSHDGRRAIPSRGVPRMERRRRPPAPRSPAGGRERGQRPHRPGPPPPCHSLNGRRGRHFESEERRRRRRRRQGEGRMGGRGTAQPHPQAAGPGPRPPERGGGNKRERHGPRRLTGALHRRLRRVSSVLHSHPPAGEGGGRGKGRRREGGKEGGGGWRAGPGPGEGEGREAGGLLSRSGARAQARRSRFLSLAPERSPPALSRSLEPGALLVRSLTRYLGRRTPPPPGRSSSVCHRSCPNALTSPRRRRRRPRPARKREGSGGGAAAHAPSWAGPGAALPSA
jgi:hypothetical protein